MIVFGYELSTGVLLLVILGLVEFTKKMGLSGKWLTVASLVIGIVGGVVWQLSILFPVITPWVGVLIGGLMMGAAAAGLFDLGKFLSGK